MVHLPVMLSEEMKSAISFRTQCNMVGIHLQIVDARFHPPVIYAQESCYLEGE